MGCVDAHCKLVTQCKSFEAMIGIGVPRKVAKATIGDISEDLLMKVKGKIGILITGDTGRGKSYLASALLNEKMPDAVMSDKYSAGWLRSKRFVLNAQACWNDRSALSTLSVVYRYSKMKALVIDDLGSEDANESSRALLLELIEEREGNERFTIVTSNLSLATLDKWEPRIASRLATFEYINLAGSDRRLKK